MKQLLLILSMVGILGAQTMFEMFGVKDTISATHPIHNGSYPDKFFHRRDLVYFTGVRGNVTVNVQSNILQTDDSELGRLVFHAELHNSKNDTLVIATEGLYHEEGRVTKFFSVGDKGQANVYIPYIWKFPIYVTTYVTTH
jgi:hypothetical protein